MLEGKVAIVTGGSRGIGLAVTKAFLDAGASVAISGLNEAHLKKADETLKSPRLRTVRADVRVAADVDRLVETTVSLLGGLDILINNAAVGHFRSVAEMTHDEWHQTIDTNLTGVFFCCHAAIPHLRTRGSGWIINVSSLASKNPFPGGAAYSATKAGLNAFSEALMQELRYDDIRVAQVLPGSVNTAFAGHEPTGADWKIAPEDVAEVILDLISLNRRSLASRVELRPSKPKKS